MAHPNEEILRAQDAALARGDVPALFDTFTDDVVAHIGGRNKLSGDYKGKEQLQEVFGRFMQSMGESAQFETHDILANDTHGVVLQRVRSERGGERIEIGGVGVFHFRDGKISEAWFYDTDPYTADAWYDAGL